MSPRRWIAWAAIAAWSSAAGGCSCRGHTVDPSAAGTTAGGAGMNAAVEQTGGDAVPPVLDASPPASDLRHYTPTAGIWKDELGVAWELNDEGTYVLVLQQSVAGGVYPVASGLLQLPGDEELGDAWYCAGEGSIFTWSDKDPKRSHSALRALTRLPECEPGDGTLSMVSEGLILRVTSTQPELAGFDGNPLGVRCIERMCHVYFSTLDDDGRSGFLVLVVETVAPYEVFGSVAMALEGAHVALAQDDGSALLACASGGVMGLGDEAGQIKVELTGLSAPLHCPSTTTAGSLDFTTGPPASPLDLH